jgi:glycosyltransferase involved in cell wall biosynthesis
MSLVTVIIPFFNSARYLEAAIQSVNGQTHAPIELILVNDGSSDDSEVVARRHAPPAHYVRQEHRGVGAARNSGLRLASGEFLAFCDSDDLWLPTKLERQLAVVHADPSVEAIFTQVSEFEEPQEPRGPLRRARERVPGALPSALLIRRSTLERVGFFAEELRTGEWADWYVRMRAHGVRESWLSEVLVARRLHQENTSRLWPEARRIEYPRIMRAHLRRRRSRESGT